MVNDFIFATDKATGERRWIPAAWLETPVLSTGFEPVKQKRQTGQAEEDGAPTQKEKR